ncbi:MAG: TlpA family protein disulfide reductase [Lewinellaceae bacterium]|nr:TlpA family protein disulfide reductase [Lewinellaceae bacterium]
MRQFLQFLFLIVLVIPTQAQIKKATFGTCETRLDQVRDSPEGNEGPYPSVRVMQELKGQKIPQFTAKTLDGKQVSSANFLGKVVVLNFYFTSCPPCVAEVPGLNRLQKLYAGQDVVFLAISRDGEDATRKFIFNTNFAFPQVINGASLIKQFCILAGFPTTMIFDRKGILQYVSLGGAVSKDAGDIKFRELQPEIQALLSAKK